MTWPFLIPGAIVVAILAWGLGRLFPLGRCWLCDVPIGEDRIGRCDACRRNPGW